jgi:glycosyltransferase involved in cell wall biosynthesis
MYPTVSVVIPTYNRADLLGEALESVFAQSFADYEIIVVDDGSTDDTAERLKGYGELVRVLRQDNLGIGPARNRGIDAARGRYVALLDSDDLWRPGKLAVQVEYMQRHPELVACSVRYSMSTAADVPAYGFDEAMGVDGVVERPMSHLARGCVFLITSAILYDKEKAAGVRYATRRGCIEDVSFQVGLFSKGGVGIAGQAIEMVYRVHATNISRQAAYISGGIELLREMDARGELPTRSRVDREDLLAYLGSIGRVAVRSQLTLGARGAACRVYRHELVYQVHLRRWRYLLFFWVMLLLPNAWVRRYWNA